MRWDIFEYIPEQCLTAEVAEVGAVLDERVLGEERQPRRHDHPHGVAVLLSQLKWEMKENFNLRL